MGPDLKEKNALTGFNYSFDTYSERGGGRGVVWCRGGGGGREMGVRGAKIKINGRVASSESVSVHSIQRLVHKIIKL